MDRVIDAIVSLIAQGGGMVLLPMGVFTMVIVVRIVGGIAKIGIHHMDAKGNVKQEATAECPLVR